MSVSINSRQVETPDSPSLIEMWIFFVVKKDFIYLWVKTNSTYYNLILGGVIWYILYG